MNEYAICHLPRIRSDFLVLLMSGTSWILTSAQLCLGVPLSCSGLIVCSTESQNSRELFTYNYSFILAKGCTLETAHRQAWESPICEVAIVSGVILTTGTSACDNTEDQRSLLRLQCPEC